MLASILFAVPFVTYALAQETTSAAVIPSVTYENPNTAFLTQTDSNGVITGQPTNMPPAFTSQPLPASIPNGLPEGLNTVPIGGLTTIVVSVGTSTTVVLGGGEAPSETGDSSAEPTGDSSEPTGADATGSDGATPTDASESNASGTDAPAPTTSEGAAAIMKVATGLLGAGAVIAAML